MRLAICNELLQERFTFEKTCEVVAGFGYEGVELAPFTFAKDIRELPGPAPREIGATAERFGLEVPALHWLLSSPPGMSVTSPDARVQAETRSFFRELINFAEGVGAGTLVFGSPRQRSVDLAAGWDFGESWKRAVSFFQEMGDLAAERGIVIALEPLDPALTNFLTNSDEALRFVGEVGSPAVRVHLDAKAMSTESSDVAGVIRKVGKGNLAHFHANDPNGLGPGMGELDFHPIAAALREIGYDGWVSVEAFDKTVDPVDLARASYDYLRSVGF
ncbi:MAG: sugar phosphate isomerase/epimerase family protein [Promethearchaeota archaeon]